MVPFCLNNIKTYNIFDLLLEMALNWIFFKEGGGGQEEQVKKWKKAE